ncbi:hypothetical protein KEM54_002940 [Ascosphaera aggregata]|nr:hypothetical protein KEM54_002940 [Ascosphaera aggregata]
MPAGLPSNVHASQHPCLRAKLSQLRSINTGSKDTQRLVHEITTIIACEALADNLSVVAHGQGATPLGYTYEAETVTPENVALIPILRSGLSMVEPLLGVLPAAVPIYHLGLFRERASLQPVEYYNNLPEPGSTGSSTKESPRPATVAIVLDPVIATGGTIAAAIQTLTEWGVSKILVVNVLGSVVGLKRAALESTEGSDAKGVEIQIWTGGVDPGLDGKGMIVPGLGDIGDRLFLALGR